MEDNEAYEYAARYDKKQRNRRATRNSMMGLPIDEVKKKLKKIEEI